MNHRRKPGTLLLRLAAGLLLCAGGAVLPSPAHAQGAWLGRVSLYLTATPNRVPADGKTRSRLRVDLRTEDGSPYADGTAVVLHTDFGYFTTTGADRLSTVNQASRGGAVIAYMVSDTPGTAVITVTALNSRLQGTVEFLAPGQTALAETRIVHVGGGWVGYAVDQNTVEARDQAWVRFGGIRLERADLVQLSVPEMVIRAGGGVLTNGKTKLEANDFYLDLPRKRGVLRRVGGDGVERLTFDLATLQVRTMDWEVPDQAFQRESASTGTWILAREITVFSGEKIVFRGGGLYTEEKKIMSLPRIWIFALPGYTGASNTQVFGLSSSGGLAVNYPYFLSAGENTTNAVAIQKGAAATSVMAQDEWGLGLQHEYRYGQTSGSLSLSNLPRSEWGAQWQDTRTLWGRADAAFSLASPDHRSLYYDSSIYDYRPGYSLNLRSFYQQPRGISSSWGAVGEWLSDPRPCGRHTDSPSYRLGVSGGVQRGAGLLSTRPQFVQELYGSLDWRPFRLNRHTNLTPSLSNVFTWDTSPSHANNLRGEVRLDRSFGERLDLNLRYSANHLSGELAQTGWQQILTSELHAYHGTKWMIYASGEKDLDSSDWYGLVTWDYYFARAWRLELMGNWYDQNDLRYSDRYVLVGWRVFQNREVGLSWSRQTGRLSLELTGLATTF
jgi:hypothetical protein